MVGAHDVEDFRSKLFNLKSLFPKSSGSRQKLTLTLSSLDRLLNPLLPRLVNFLKSGLQVFGDIPVRIVAFHLGQI